MNSNKDHVPLNKSLSRNTKLFVLLAFVMVGISYAFQNQDTAIAIGSVGALFTVMIVDYFELLSKNHPKVWRAIKYLTIAVIILMTLIALYPES